MRFTLSLILFLSSCCLICPVLSLSSEALAKHLGELAGNAEKATDAIKSRLSGGQRNLEWDKVVQAVNLITKETTELDDKIEKDTERFSKADVETIQDDFDMFCDKLRLFVSAVRDAYLKVSDKPFKPVQEAFETAVETLIDRITGRIEHYELGNPEEDLGTELETMDTSLENAEGD